MKKKSPGKKGRPKLKDSEKKKSTVMRIPDYAKDAVNSLLLTHPDRQTSR